MSGPKHSNKSKPKLYYTMIMRAPNRKWTPKFGDYVRQVVAQEMSYQIRHNWPKGTKFKIIKSLDTQKSIDAQIEIENATHLEVT